MSREKSKITREELKEQYGLSVGDVITIDESPQHGHILLAYYRPDNTVIPVYLTGNCVADMLALEYILHRAKSFKKHKIQKTGLTIS